MGEEVHRELGKHDADIEHLKAEDDELRTEVKKILAELSKAEGGWRAMIALGTLAGALGAFLVHLFSALGGTVK